MIERYQPGPEDLGQLTELLHRAYAPLLAAGMNYIAATQSEEVTRDRIDGATASWIAKIGNDIVGTISYYTTRRSPVYPAWYLREDVGIFAQFAVDPALQKRGLGRALLRAVERFAVQERKSELACDTAENAAHLRTYYANLGFREVDLHRYPHASYNSVILSKLLNGEP